MSPQVVQIVTMFFVLIMSLSVHEAAHAWAAKIQGDNTAERMGRLTLNPLPHIDILGTIILPLMMMFAGGGFFGWAKPVPVDTRNLTSQRWGHAVVAAAGPAANIILCLLAIFFITFHGAYLQESVPQGSFFYPILDILRASVWINAILAFFNLIPIPPLDGGAIFSSILPSHAREWFENYVVPYGSFILLALIFSGALKVVVSMTSVFVNRAQFMIAGFLI